MRLSYADIDFTADVCGAGPQLVCLTGEPGLCSGPLSPYSSARAASHALPPKTSENTTRILNPLDKAACLEKEFQEHNNGRNGPAPRKSGILAELRAGGRPPSVAVSDWGPPTRHCPPPRRDFLSEFRTSFFGSASKKGRTGLYRRRCGVSDPGRTGEEGARRAVRSDRGDPAGGPWPPVPRGRPPGQGVDNAPEVPGQFRTARPRARSVSPALGPKAAAQERVSFDTNERIFSIVSLGGGLKTMLDAMEAPSHARHLLLQLNSQRTKGFLCDVIIVVQNALFRAHKNILAASSIYLKSLVVHDNLINLDHEMVSPGIFRIILDYIYTGRLSDGDQASEQNLGAVLAAASYLQLLDLVALCKKKLKRNGKYSHIRAASFSPYGKVGQGAVGRYRASTPVIQSCFPGGVISHPSARTHLEISPVESLLPHPLATHTGELYAPPSQGSQLYPPLQPTCTPTPTRTIDFPAEGLFPLSKYAAEHLGLKQEKASELLAQASQHLLADPKAIESLFPLSKLAAEHLGLAHDKMEALSQPPAQPHPGEVRSIDRYSPS
ncbi:HIC1 protein, partial [Atractosteus spatula]|nr:HIC1 protein [Atractosteus spatula]